MSEVRAQIRLAVPLAVGYIGHQFMSVVDTAMLGRYSEEALAGVGVANGLLWTVVLLGMGMIMGMDSLVPQAVGAGDHRRARALLLHGLRTAALLGVPLSAVAALTPLVLVLFGVEPGAREVATVYIFGRLPAIMPVLLYTALRSYLQAYSVTRPMVVAVVVGNVVNALANVVLIFGDRALVAAGLPAIGLPELGALGAALSTTLVTCLSLLICVPPTLVVYRQHRTEPDSKPSESAMPSPSRSIIRLGLPIGLQLFAEVGIIALVGTLAGRLGAVSAAAHQTVLTVVSFGFNAVLGVGAATAVRVGLAVGAGDHRRARSAGLIGMGLGAIFLGTAGLAYLIIPAALGRVMTDQLAVVQAAVPLFHVAAAFQVFDALQAVGAGALRGAGDTRSAMWAHFVGHYLLGATVGIIGAFVLERGTVGLWWGLGTGLSFAGVVVTVRFWLLTRHSIARAA